MTERLERLWAWLHTPEGTKIFRYLMVSVVTTGVSFVVLFLVYGVFRLWTEVPSTVFANVTAIFPSYWLNRRWAWGKGGRSNLVREVIPFWMMSGFGIAFSTIGATLARNIGQSHHFGHVEQTGLVLLANVLSFAVLWFLKLMLFNRLFRVPTLLEEIGEQVDAGEHPESAGVR